MFNNVSPTDIDIDSIYLKIPSEIRRKPTASEITANFVNSLIAVNKKLEKELSTESDTNPNPYRLMAAGTYIAYAKHLAKLNQYEEALKQVEKAEKIYKMIDFTKTVMNQSARQLIYDCKVLKDAYSNITTKI